ncbi:hypothetical protein KY345_07015 [Candidatus Woesearchaeota archaeon]|nr:hypothetical protein [Candidatus Woesearchaeota archaeon]
MKKILLVILLCIFLVGCKPAVVEEIEEIEEETAAAKARGDEINFMCEDAGGVKYYFLGEDRAYINALNGERESWITPEGYFYKMVIGSTTYLVEEDEADELSMSVDAMVVSLKTSDKYEGFDCEKGVVTEEHMRLPGYTRITNEELAEIMLQEMMQG